MVTPISKPYLAATKIGVYRTGKYKTEKGWRANNVKSLIVFEKENILTFSIRQLQGSAFQYVAIYKLCAYLTKSGETRFVFYRFIGNNFQSIRTSSPNSLRSVFATLNKKPALPKIHLQRLYQVISKFAKKYKVKTKHLSKDPVSLLVQLCYPGTINFNEDTLSRVSLGKYLKQDSVKLCLNTNGKYSRKLLYQAIEKSPYSAQFILTIARYYRIHNSLDDAQKFIHAFIQASDQRFNCIGTRITGFIEFDFYSSTSSSIQNKPASFFKFLKQIPVIGPGSLIHYMENNRTFYIRDTFRMLEDLNGNQGFDITNIVYRSLGELHDALAAVHPTTNRRKVKNTFTHYDFDPDSTSMQICEQLSSFFNNQQRWINDSIYRMVYPKGTKMLLDQANEMHNCSFYYRDDIKNQSYIIFCLQKYLLSSCEWKTQYMFGYRVQQQWGLAKENKNPLQLVSLVYDQAVGKCNKTIEPGLLSAFLELLDRLYLDVGLLTPSNVTKGLLPAGLDLAAV